MSSYTAGLAGWQELFSIYLKNATNRSSHFFILWVDTLGDSAYNGSSGQNFRRFLGASFHFNISDRSVSIGKTKKKWPDCSGHCQNVESSFIILFA